ncbi:MAG: hypothetical protein HFI17_08670 [Lachnospiraceae bacterium]|jgi:uncharacterized membrane protein YgaE (UPF0421/DUF939 family)|nr:hypothetical protein [Lachnospiraceae bacterium]MCI9600563.1 hypothetical protein [Lachnospiraceae bacterium]
MGTGMDSHGRRKMAIKVLKIAVGSCMAVAVAQFFELPYATSAGIVTLLTVQNTRRDTIRLAAERLLSFLLSVLLVFVCFRYIGKLEWVNYGVYIFLMVHVCYFFGWENTISVNAVMGTHYLLTPDYSLNFAASELAVIAIGTALALLMNWHMPSNLKTLREDIRKAEDDMQQVLQELACYLEGKLDGAHIWLDLDQLEQSIHRGLERAHEHAHNTLSEEDHYYIEYMEMRLQQCALLQAIRHRVWKIDGMPEQAKIISDYLRYLAPYVHEKNIPDRQSADLQQVFDQMKQQPLPESRDEFESRAILYHVLLDLEDFLFVKKRFADQYIDC